jgi:hypothetical protein
MISTLCIHLEEPPTFAEGRGSATFGDVERKPWYTEIFFVWDIRAEVVNLVHFGDVPPK